MSCRRRIIKSPMKKGTLTQKQIRKAVMAVRDKYIKIGRIGKMELKIDLEVQKVDNGFILFKDVQGIKLQDKPCESKQEVYVTFPEVQTRITELLAQLIDDLNERISEQAASPKDS